MNLNPHRPWITPLVIGAFVLSAVTGVLMFFHLDSGLNKLAHEWLSWAMLVGVALHALVNLGALKRYFSQTTGRVVMAAFAGLLALSFIPLGGAAKGKPPFIAPIQAMARAPLSALAPVLGMDAPTLRERLQSLGIQAASDTQSLESLVGQDTRKQVDVLAQLARPTARP